MECQQIAKTVGWLGESWGFWLQTGAFFVSAIAGVAVIWYNGRQSRIRALIDLIIHQKTDSDLLIATSLVYDLHKQGATFSAYIDHPESKERIAILKVLNNHEFISSGIRQKVFDEDMYKRLQCSNVLKVWGSSRGFIQEIRSREKKNTIFQDFEWLAKRWDNNPLQAS